MTQAQHADPDKLLPGEYYRISPQGLGALVRKGRIERKPKLGHEVRLHRPGKSDCWVTFFAGKYEVRCYSHGPVSGDEVEKTRPEWEL